MTEQIAALTDQVDALRQRAEKAEAELAALRAAHRWIPVSERQPENSGIYIALVVCDDDIKMVAPRHFIPADGWDVYYSEVTHWMPMPEPPQDGEA